MPRAYCRTCDKAVESSGKWPHKCVDCKTPIEAHPVPDVVEPGLRILFVGINPGVQTARARRHFANPANAFWGALHDEGFTPRRLAPDEGKALLALGLGVTNVVTRATPGSADVTREDVAHGRPRLEALVRDARPQWLAFVGKQAFNMATGAKKADHGAQGEPLWGACVFVLPSTSPANAGVSAAEKVRWFRALKVETSQNSP